MFVRAQEATVEQAHPGSRGRSSATPELMLVRVCPAAPATSTPTPTGVTIERGSFDVEIDGRHSAPGRRLPLWPHRATAPRRLRHVLSTSLPAARISREVAGVWPAAWQQGARPVSIRGPRRGPPLASSVTILTETPPVNHVPAPAAAPDPAGTPRGPPPRADSHRACTRQRHRPGRLHGQPSPRGAQLR
jgi:hypothetical protein